LYILQTHSTYRQRGLLCSPQNFALSSKVNKKNLKKGKKNIEKHIFWNLWGIFKHFPKFEGHISSGRHTNKTLNLLTKL
jgi:hypothetical protein